MVNSSSLETSGLSGKSIVKDVENVETFPKSLGLSLSLAAKVESQPIAKRFSIPALGQEIQKIINKKFDSKLINQHSLLFLSEQGESKSCFTKMSEEDALSLFTLIGAKSLLQAYPSEALPFKHITALLKEMLQGGALALLPKDLGALADLMEYPLSLLEVPKPEDRFAKVLEDLQSLPEGNKLAVMGHGTLIYRFCRNKTGGFDLKVYTSSKKSSAVIGEGGNPKLKLAPVLKFANIDEGGLPNQLIGLVKAITGQGVGANSEMELLKGLSPFLVEGSIDEIASWGGKSLQALGVSQVLLSKAIHSNSWECLKGFLSANLPKESAERIFLTVQLSSMLGFYQKGVWKEDSSRGETARILLKESCRQQLHQMLSMIEDGNLQNGELEPLVLSSYATTVDLLEKIKLREDEICEARKALTKEPVPHSLETDAEITALEASKLKGYSPKPQAPSKFKKAPLLFFTKEQLQDPAAIFAHLKSLRDFLKASSDKRTAIHMIDDLVSKLPFPQASSGYDGFWSNVAKPEIVIKELSSLLKIYQKASHSMPPVPELHNTAWSLLAMTHKVSCLQDEAAGLKMLPERPIYYIGNAIDKNPFNVFLNKEGANRRQLIEDYFHQHKIASQFSEGPAYFDYSKPLTISKKVPAQALKQNPELSLYETIFQANPALKNEILSALDFAGKEMVNWSTIPKDIRAHLYLYLSFGEDAEKLLEKHGLSYLVHLKRAAVVASMVLPNTMKVYDEYKPFNVKENDFGWMFESSLVSDPYESPLSTSPTLFLFSENSLLNTLDWVENKENLTLKEFNSDVQKMEGVREAILQKYGIKKGGKSFLTAEATKKLATAHAQPEIQPHHVIAYFSDHIPSLYHRETQASFEGLFFKTPVMVGDDGHRTYSQPVVDALKDPGFIKQCVSFIRYGVDHYLVHSKSMPLHDRIRGASFFVRLGCHLQRLRPESKELRELLTSFNKVTDAFVEDPSIKLNDKVLLHYDRIYRYLGTSFDKLTTDDITTIFGSWFFVNAYSNQYLLPYVKHDAQTFVLQLLEHLMANPGKKPEISKLVKSIVHHLPSYNQLPENNEWDSKSYPHLTNGAYSIDLATGRVDGPAIKNGKLIHHTSFTSTPLYKHVFEQQLSNYQTHTFYESRVKECNFIDSIYNGMVAKLIPKGTQNTWESGIEFNQKFHGSPDGAWELFRVVEGRRERFVLPNLVEEILPGSLIAGYHHWVAEEGDPKERKIIVTDPKTGKEVAFLDMNGFIHRMNEGGKGSTLISNLAKEAGKGAFFSQFEREKFIHFEFSDAKDPKLQKIVLDRYTSVHDKSRLEFITHADGTMRWQSNEQYALATPGSAVQLTSFTNFLHLVHQEDPKKQKILVPIQDFDPTTTKPMSTEGALDVKDVVLSQVQNWNDNPLRQWKSSHSGRYRFVEFDLVNGGLKPKSQEARILLAALQLQQKNYTQAAKLLRQINAFEDLSETSQAILGRLLSSDKVMKDRTHDCTGIRYLAMFLLFRYYQRTPADKHLVKIPIDEKNLINYQLISPKINSAVRLTGKEFELIAEAAGSNLSAVSPAQSKGLTGQMTAGSQESKGTDKDKLTLAPMGIHEEPVGELYEQYFTATKPLLQDEPIPDFDPQIDGLLQKGEMVYSAALKKEIENFKEEYKTGKVQLEESLFHVLKGGDHKGVLQSLLGELGKKHSNLSKIEAGLSKKLLKLANQSVNDSEALVKGVKIHGGVEKQVSMEELLYFFIQKDKSLYRLANPSLSDQEIEKLYQATAEFLQIRIQRQQVQRSRDLTAQAVKLGADMQGHANKIKEFELVVDQLGAELCKKQLYEVQEFPLFSLFEAMSNLKLRPIQVELLKKLFSKNEAGKYRHIALQLIMGGGKTSVLAALQLAESCVEGRIPLFLTPRMQFETVKPSLGESLKNLSIELIPLDFVREDLDISMLTYIRDTLVKTKEHHPKERRQAIMMTPDALQTLELELHSLVLSQQKGKGVLGVSKATVEKVTLLQQILKDFRTSCDAIGDEVHLLEDENKEINFPSGEKVHVSPERIDLVKHIFAIFSSKEKNVEVDDGKVCSFDELLDLTNKTRTEIQSNLYQEVIAPKLAALLAERHIPLALSKSPKHWSAFVRYATGLMNIRVEEYLDGKISKEELTKTELEEDVPFLEYMRNGLFASDDPALQEAAHQIALSKHLITTVLPLTLNNFSGQNFGRTFDSTIPGKVIPFLAVGTPATTEFGYHWETACYQMMEGLCGGCEQEQVLHFANTLKKAGQFDAKVRNVAFSDTVFYQYFKTLTGRELGDLECPNPQPGDVNPYDMKVVEEIMGTISNNPLVRLEIEAFTAGEHLHFFPERLMSTSQSLFRQVNTFRASSGTPTNHLCYPIDLQEGLLLDKGTEGRIVHNMRLKAKGKSLVHTTNTQDPEAVLSGILSGHKEKERIGGFQDFSGMFKGKDNLEIASGFMRALKKCGNPQKAVAFFYKPPGYPTPDFMAVVTADHPDEPVILEGTKPSDFEKVNLSAKDIFVYYDERHTQGTDVKQLSTAINIQTKGESGNLPDDLQSAMRLREYLNPDSQDVEYLIHENAKAIFEPIFGKFPPTVDQLLTWELRNLAIAKARGCLKAYKAMLDDILYQIGTERVLNCDVTNQAEMHVLLKVFGPFIRREQGDDPFAQFGRLDQTVATLDHLQDYSQRIKARFLKSAGALLPKDKALALELSFDEASGKILAHAKENQFLQSTVSQPYGGKAESQAFGMQVQQQVQVQQEQQVKVTVKVEQELMIEQEYKMMNQVKGPLIPRKEVVWTPEEANKFLKAIQESGGSSTHYALPGMKQKVTQLKEIMFDKKIFKYDKPYFKAIPETVFATWNFLMPYDDMVLPVFNNLHRLMSQVLNIKTNDGKWCQVLVTAFEAKQWKKMIEEGTVENVWLTHSNLNSLANAQEELKEEDALIKGMLPIALLAGDIGFLAKHLELAKEWLNEKDPSGDKAASAELYKLKRRLAHLAVHRSKDKLQILQNTPLFGDSNLAEAMKKLNIDVLKKQIHLGTNKDDLKVTAQQVTDATPKVASVDSTAFGPEEIPMTPKAPVSEMGPSILEPSSIASTPAKEEVKPSNSDSIKVKPSNVDSIKVKEVEKPSLPTPPPVNPAAPVSFWAKVYKGFMDFLWAVWQVISWPFRKLIELASA